MKKEQGFSLVEIAVVMVIIGLIIGGSMTAVTSLQENQRIKDNTALLNNAIDTLMGFAVAQNPPRLPCPDTTGDGLEDAWPVGPPNPGTCPSYEGWLPFATLGLPAADAWGNRVRYRVDRRFTELTGVLPTTVGIQLNSQANLQVWQSCGAAPCTGGAGDQITAQNLPAVLISHGKNGRGARTSGVPPSGFTLIAQPPGGTHERFNTDGRNAGDTADIACPLAPALPTGACQFISHEPRETAGTGGEFDDAVAWLPAATLFNQLVKAGRLP